MAASVCRCDQTADGPTIRLVVAVLSFRRPALLGTLLERLASVEQPSSCRTTLVVIDNDRDGSAREIVDASRSRLALRHEDIYYVIEPRRGIPVARNRAIAEASATGADAMCFIDDDEFPHARWLVNLVDCWRRTGAHLIGGPVRIARSEANLTRWQRFVHHCVASWTMRKNDKTGRVAAAGSPFMIFTNNWLCDVGWLRRSGVRFDERLLFSGGSDSVFSRAARAAGCASAWCPEAIVYETLEPSRLSFRYQFHRAVSQSVNHFQMRTPKVTISVVLITVMASLVKAALSAGLVLLPVFGWATPMVAVRGFGWSVGRLKALFGGTSRLYA